MIKHYTLFVFLLLPLYLLAQPERVAVSLNIKQIDEAVVIDGLLEEAFWEQQTKTTPFLNKWPVDTGYAASQTEVRMAYDQNFVYIAAVCTDGPEYIIQTLKRDQNFFDSDGFAVVIDPVGRKTNGFFFGLNALGAQSEGLIGSTLDDGDFNFDWDNRWFSAVKNYDDHWVVEIAIPFKTLRFEEGSKRWAINFIRNDIKRNRYSTWSYVPLNFMGVDMGYMGDLFWDQAPPVAKGNVSLIPYVTGGLTKDYEEGTDLKATYNAGFDAKVALSSALNLDLTVNPDFSQVDVDEQVTNLDRFNLFFPEKRNFFLENSDLFTSFGIPPTRPFFSRRIGLEADGNGLPVPIPIYFGARLTGNLTDKLRIGLMNIQTGPQDDVLGQNIAVASFSQQVLERSTITGILTNRQAFSNGSFDADDFGRNAGAEFNYLNKAGSWGGWAQLHASFKSEKYDKNLYYSAGVFHLSRNLEVFTAYSKTDENFYTDVGFNARAMNYDAERDTFVRLGYGILYNSTNYTFYPKNNERVTQHGPRFETAPILNDDGSLNDWNLTLDYRVMFNTQGYVSLGYVRNDVRLPFATELVAETPLPVGRYLFNSVRGEYQSDPRKKFNYNLNFEYGQFYNGTKTSLGTLLRFRQQPWGNFALRLSRDYVQLPDPYGTADLWLIGPQININFNRNIFWTTYLQYNTQWDNFNINSRLQWRFKPMSDLFLVYTDNYGLETFGLRNRALVLKLNYWLTL